MHLNFGARIKCQPIQILKHCTLKQRSVSKHTNFNQAAELVVHCTRVVGVKSLGKMRGMTRLMDLLFFDKGRIDKKNQIQCTRALRPVSLPLFAAPPQLYELPPPSTAPRLLIDFTMHQVL